MCSEFCFGSIRLTVLTSFALLLGGAFVGCNGIQSNKNEIPAVEVYREGVTTESGEPAYITVQHCLISFRGTRTKATRSIEQAESLARDLFEKVQAGADFDEIVKKYTDDNLTGDSPPGIYHMANHGFPVGQVDGEQIFARGTMASAFGKTGFTLEVGQYGLAEYHEIMSPFGWHIIKRIK